MRLLLCNFFFLLLLPYIYINIYKQVYIYIFNKHTSNLNIDSIQIDEFKKKKYVKFKKKKKYINILQLIL